MAKESPGLQWLALGLLLFATTATARAANLGGVISDADTGQPLAGVFVRLASPGLDLSPDQTTVSSDRDGRFQWTDLPPAAYELEFSALDYETLTLNIDLRPEGAPALEVALNLAAYVLGELTVVGEMSSIEGDLQTGYVNLDQSTLASIPGIIEDDPLRALQLLPGVQAASDISSGLYIRGGGPDQTLVLMEGVPVYNPTHAFGFFSTFNNDVVRDLALYKGAYPAQYGGRLGAVLDVDMLEDTNPELSGKFGVSLIAARLFLSGRAGQDHWWASGRRSFLGPLLRAIDSPENPIPDYNFYDLNAGYTSYRGGGKTRFILYKGKDNISVDADANTQLALGWGNTVLMMEHERFLSDNIEAQIMLSHSRYESLTDAEILATEFDVLNEIKDTTLSGRLDWGVTPNHRLVGGAGYSWYAFDYRQDFNRTNQIDYGTKPGELAAFVEDRWFVDDLSTVRSGLRYRLLSDGKRTLWEPRFAANRQVRPDLRLKIGGGIYHQYLQLVSTEGFSSGDYYLPIDQTAEPGRSWQVVLGGDWQANPETQVSLEVYNTGLQNLVELDSKVPVDQVSFAADDLFVTGGKGYARGVELFVQHKHEQWSGWLGYTLGWTRRTFDELNGGESFAPKYDRRHDINVMLSRQVGSWKLSYAFRFATGQTFTPAASRFVIEDSGTGIVDDEGQILYGPRNSGRLKPYHRMDVSARRPIHLFGLSGELVLEVFNIYNRRNEWFVQYNTEEAVTEATVVRMLPLIPSVGVNFEF